MGADIDSQSASNEPPSRRIAALLRAAIRSGEYRAGQALPSTSALVEQHQVSSQTVQSAIRMLRAEGLVEGRVGAGVFVRHRPSVQRVARNRLSRAEREAGRGAMMSDAAQGGFTVTVQVDVRFEPADAATAESLRITEGDEVVVRERVMSADDVPVQLATSRLPRAITRDTPIEQNDTGEGGTHRRLDELGHRLGHAVELVTARPASADEAAQLRIQLGAPVFEVERVAFTVDGVPVEVNRMVMTGERYQLVYEIAMD